MIARKPLWDLEEQLLWGSRWFVANPPFELSRVKLFITADMIGRFICSDVLVHTWDVARATGGDETLDADAVTGSFAGLKPMDAMIRMPGVFGPKLEAAEGASEQDQFLAFIGRQV